MRPGRKTLIIFELFPRDPFSAEGRAPEHPEQLCDVVISHLLEEASRTLVLARNDLHHRGLALADLLKGKRREMVSKMGVVGLETPGQRRLPDLVALLGRRARPTSTRLLQSLR